MCWTEMFYTDLRALAQLDSRKMPVAGIDNKVASSKISYTSESAEKVSEFPVLQVNTLI